MKSTWLTCLVAASRAPPSHSQFLIHPFRSFVHPSWTYWWCARPPLGTANTPTEWQLSSAESQLPAHRVDGSAQCPQWGPVRRQVRLSRTLGPNHKWPASRSHPREQVSTGEKKQRLRNQKKIPKKSHLSICELHQLTREMSKASRWHNITSQRCWMSGS